MSQSVSAPIAKKIPHILETHAEQRVDNYYWMRDDNRQDPEILTHLEAENDYLKAVMAPHEALKNQLFEEMKGKVDDKKLETVKKQIDGIKMLLEADPKDIAEIKKQLETC